MEQVEVEAAVTRLVDSLSPQEWSAMSQLVAIPNVPDASPYVMGLQSRIGEELVATVSKKLESARAALGVRYDVIQPVVQRALGVQQLP